MLKLIKEDTIKPIAADDNAEIEDNNDIENEETKITDVDELIINNACQELINGLIQASWDFISQTNAAIATINSDFKDAESKKEISELLNSIVDDSTINIGVLHKVFELLNTEKAELLASGEAKAEDIISNSNN